MRSPKKNSRLSKDNFSSQKSFFLFILFFYGIFHAVAQCPTTIDLNPSFCDIQAPTVADLQATDNGSGIAWFATATSTTALSPGLGLINGEDYFLDSSAGNCGNRIAVTVSLYSAPTGQNFQGICVSDANEATIASLNATGNNVQWYNNPFGGTPLTNNSVITSGTIYYAGQTNPITGCLTSRLPVFVVVNVVNEPVGESLQIFCNDPENPPTISNLIASGNNNWYLTSTSALVLDPAAPLINGQTYYGTTIVPPCESTQRLEVTVSILPENEAGDDGSLTLCETDIATSPDINLFDSLLGIPSSLGVWTGPVATTNGNLGTLEISSLTATGSPYIFTYTVSTSPECPPDTATVTITIEPLVDAGEDGIAFFCPDDTPADLFTFLGGTPDLGGTWSPALASGSGIFNPLLDLSGSYVYTLPATAFCPADSATVIVTVSEIPEAGENGSLTLCESDLATAPNMNLFDSLSGIPSNLGVWTGPVATANGNLGTLDVSNLSESGSPYVFTYTVTTSPQCPPDIATVTITVEPLVNAGEDGVAVFCGNDAPADLFTFLGGTPDLGGTWSPALASGTGIFDPLLDLSGNYVYTLPATAFCPAASATVNVTVNQIPEAGEDGSLTLCESDLATAPDVNLFDSLLGTPLNIGVWTGPFTTTNGSLGTLDVSNLSESGSPYVFTYTVTTSPLCPPDVATVTITIAPAVEPGDDGTAFFCGDDGPADLIAFLGGTPDFGGTWSPTMASGNGTFDPLVDSPGVYVYTLPGTLFCPSASSIVTVTVAEIAEAGENGNFDICEADVATAPDINLFDTLLGTPSSIGVWTGPVSTTNGNLGTLNVSNLTISGSPYVFTYTVTTSLSCPPDVATVTVTVEPLYDAGSNGTVVFCDNNAPADLFSFLGGTPDLGGVWSPSLSSGTGFFDPLVDLAGTYVYSFPGTSLCSSSSASVTVTVNPAPDAGENGIAAFCEDDASADLFAFLGGIPESGGIWTPNLSSGTGIFDPSIDLPGTYTYTVNGPAGCLPDTATVSVTVDGLPTNIPADLNTGVVCLNSDATIQISNATNLSDGNYQLSYQLSGATVFNEVVTVVFENGIASFIIPTTVLNAIGNYTLNIDPILSNTANACGTSGHTFDAFIFEIEEVPTPIFSGSSVYCETDNATVFSLSSAIIGSQPIVWYDALQNGTAYANDTLLIDGTTYYAAIVSDLGCESTTRLQVTVTVEDCDTEELKLIIPDGFSPNGDGINDAFVIKNIRTLYPNFSISIYNRWGNILYEGNASKPDWDGNSEKGVSGSKLPTGVYFYILNFNDGTRKAVQGRLYLSK
ncbi:gliding motility-associated C-terminal domain-containing protein [Flavobacterium sp. PLA-1-15]|uniref:gliding motility-associated C-terminal domain-containing protein n=1 Tax=Flavobacterium sp. PLA-1-15 TaxID=3380533 RepID=UPI003B81AD75